MLCLLIRAGTHYRSTECSIEMHRQFINLFSEDSTLFVVHDKSFAKSAPIISICPISPDL